MYKESPQPERDSRNFSFLPDGSIQYISTAHCLLREARRMEDREMRFHSLLFVFFVPFVLTGRARIQCLAFSDTST
jgi:hypothetical protein